MASGPDVTQLVAWKPLAQSTRDSVSVFVESAGLARLNPPVDLMGVTVTPFLHPVLEAGRSRIGKRPARRYFKSL